MIISTEAEEIQSFVDSLADMGDSSFKANLEYFISLIPYEKIIEVYNVMNDPHNESQTIVNYLSTKTDDPNLNAYKKLMLYSYTAKKENKEILENSNKKRRKILLLNILVLVLCSLFTFFLFNPNFSSWAYNASEMIAAIPTTYYEKIVGAFFFVNVVSIVLWLSTLDRKGYTDKRSIGKLLVEKYSVYVANKDVLTDFISIYKKCSILFAITMDLMVSNIILLAFFMESIFKIHYGFNIFLAEVIYTATFLIFSIILKILDRNKNKKLKEMYEETEI